MTVTRIIITICIKAPHFFIICVQLFRGFCITDFNKSNGHVISLTCECLVNLFGDHSVLKSKVIIRDLMFLAFFILNPGLHLLT